MSKIEWVEPIVLAEDGKHKFIRVLHPYDCETLGKEMGHCAGTHYVWVSEERAWQFFTVIDGSGKPHITIHCKQKKYDNSSATHPREKLPRPPYVLPKNTWGYACFRHVEAALKERGEEYEVGKYGPIQFNVSTYSYGTRYERRQAPLRGSIASKLRAKREEFGPVFEQYLYGECLNYGYDPVTGNYVQSREYWKARADSYKKKCETAEAKYQEWLKTDEAKKLKEQTKKWLYLPGTTFTLDDEECVVLSANGRGQSGQLSPGGTYYDLVIPWFEDNLIEGNYVEE